MSSSPEKKGEKRPNWQPPAALTHGLAWLKRLWRRTENMVFLVVFLLTVLYFLLQTSPVQNWLIQKITAYLSEELQTTVRIDHVDIEFFDNLVLDNFFVADQRGDTLLFAGKLVAGLNSNIFSLMQNKLEFNEISLRKARVNILRAEGEEANNLQFILGHPWFKSKPGPDKPKSPFSVRVQVLNLEDVEFRTEDQVRGEVMAVQIPSGRARINNLDVNSKIADIQSVDLQGLSFVWEDYPSKPLPATSQTKGDNAHPVSVKNDTLTNIAPRKFFTFKINQFRLADGRVRLDKFHVSPAKETLPEVMDYNHLNIRDVALELDSLVFNDDLAFAGKIRHFAARESSGFEVTHGEARYAVVTDTLTGLYGLRLETGGTTLGDTFEMRYTTYRDFKKFNNNVFMHGAFAEGSRLRLGDLMHFSNPVARNSFFQKNRNEVAEISGYMDGLVNKINGRDLRIRLANGTVFEGDFDGDDMARGRDEMRIGFDAKRLQSNMATLRAIVPGFNAPTYFDKLGNFTFKGSYQLLFGFNHILAGDLFTDIGSGKTDMELDLTGGKEKATYSGYLNMNHFDLAAWTGNRQFGNTTFRVNISEGAGLTLPTLNTTVTGTVDTFTFRGYTYRDIKMNGQFAKNLFDGKLGVEDPNMNFTFDGTINFQDSVPVYNFQADVKRLDLGALNLLEKDWVVSGRIANLNLRGNSVQDVAGSMSLRNIRIVQDKNETHRIDSVGFQSLVRPNGSRYFAINSEVAAGYLDGNFDLATAAGNLQKVFSRYYPEFAQRLGFFNPDSMGSTDNYVFNLRVINTKGLTRLAGIGLDTLRDFQALGRVEGRRGLTDLRLEVPMLRMQGVEVQEVSFAWNGLADKGSYELYVHKTLLGKRALAPVRLSGSTTRQKVRFQLQAENLNNILKNINLRGSLSLSDSLWQVRFNPSDITLFNETWLMSDENYVRFGKGFFATQDFELFGEGDKRIILDSLGGQGLRVGLTNFDLNFLDNFLKVKDVTYRGKIYDFDLAIQNVFLLQGMSLHVNTDTLFVKNQPYGFITGNIDMAHMAAPLTWKVIVASREHRLRLAGGWLPGGKVEQTIDEDIGSVKPKEFQLQADASNFPMNILEQFIPGISGTAGRFDLQARLGGPFKKPRMDGAMLVHDGAFQLDYLKSYFYIKNQKVLLNSQQIWADGDTIWDADRNSMAFVRGGLRHDHFRDWRIDCSVTSATNDFAILNTQKGDNDLFYGQGIGRFRAKFSGTFSRTDIEVDAVTGKDTRLYVPLTGGEDTKEVSFIKFKPKDQAAEPEKTRARNASDLKGLNFDLNLTVTDEAEVQLIFDEQAGDIVKGRGVGDLNFSMNREGAFRMFGQYTIRRGEYLFTLLNLVNKPFTVAQGGTITWFGDPYGAQINLDATYDENTSVYNFLQDELELLAAGGGGQDDPRIKEAQRATRVTVTMHLKGELFKPSITFDLDFPTLTNELKTLTTNKLRLLQQDPNELNRQVFGLVVIGSFLPSSSATLLQNADVLSTTLNTVTQVLSNQFSNYLSALAAEWFGKKLSSIDFDLAYNEYRNTLAQPGQPGLNQVGRELQVRLSSGLNHDRVRINVGSQFGLGNASPGVASSTGFLGEDVTVEFLLNEKRQWRLKIYQRTEPDVTGGALRARFGAGLAFHKDYDSFDEMMQAVGKWFKKGKE
ncbi:MAG: translocation/assembly module TamB domain-containing protein [Saprospiraceae bacterium]